MIMGGYVDGASIRLWQYQAVCGPVNACFCWYFSWHVLCFAASSLFLDLGVSKNRGTPKWMVSNGKPY